MLHRHHSFGGYSDEPGRASKEGWGYWPHSFGGYGDEPGRKLEDIQQQILQQFAHCQAFLPPYSNYPPIIPCHQFFVSSIFTHYTIHAYILVFSTLYLYTYSGLPVEQLKVMFTSACTGKILLSLNPYGRSAWNRCSRFFALGKRRKKTRRLRPNSTRKPHYGH